MNIQKSKLISKVIMEISIAFIILIIIGTIVFLKLSPNVNNIVEASEESSIDIKQAYSNYKFETYILKDKEYDQEYIIIKSNSGNNNLFVIKREKKEDNK